MLVGVNKVGFYYLERLTVQGNATWTADWHRRGFGNEGRGRSLEWLGWLQNPDLSK